MSSTRTTPSPSSCQRTRSSTMSNAATIDPQTMGGSSRKASPEKTTMPPMLPRMSSRYASSGSNRMNVRATPFPTHAITATVRTKIPLRLTQRGSGAQPNPPSRVIGARAERDRKDEDERDEQRQRRRRPRKQVAVGVGPQEADADAEEAGHQDEVRQVGEMDVVRAVQRISASSTNSIRKLSAINRSRRFGPFAGSAVDGDFGINSRYGHEGGTLQRRERPPRTAIRSRRSPTEE